MLALALVLNALKLYQFPNGGSIDLAMIPIFFFALRWGCGWGLLEGFLFGLLQMFIDGAVAWGWQSLLLDYLVAFTPWAWRACSAAGASSFTRAYCWAAWRAS
jgi:thiamine transporter